MKMIKIVNFVKKHKTSIFFIIIFCLFVFNVSFFKILKGMRAKNNLENKIIKIKKEITDLNNEIYNLQHNAGYIELLARKNLAMCKPGEMIYKFNNFDSSNSSNSSKNFKIDEKNN